MTRHATRRLASLVLLGGAAMASSGCWWLAEIQERQRAEHSAEMDAWVGKYVGKTTDDLLKAKGPPNVVLDDPKGQKIWVYTTETRTMKPGAITISRSGDSLSATQANGSIDTFTQSAMFWIDKDGRITKADWHER